MSWSLSRREFLAAVAAAFPAAAVTPLLTACGRGAGTNSTIENAGKRLVIAITSPILTLDPAQANMALDGFLICNMMEPLTWHNRQIQHIPRLALSWETNKDATEWSFRLRPGVKFQDGTDFNADSVKFHFDRIRDPATKSKRFTKVKEIEAIDVLEPLLVKFRFNVPYGVWPVVVRDAFGAIVSPAQVKKTEDAEREAAKKNGKSPELSIAFSKDPIGTGPYQFAESELESFVRMKRFAGYRDAAEHHFSEVEFRVVREPTTRITLLEQGQVDIGDIMFAHTEAAERTGKIQVVREPKLATRYVGFNNMKPPFDDVRVRRACNHAFDRETFAQKAFRGNVDAAYAPFPPALSAYNHDMPRYEYDPDKARALLRDANFKEGTKVDMWTVDASEESTIAVVAAEQLGRVGIDVNIKRFDRAAYWAQFDEYQTDKGTWFPTKPGVFDCFVAGWVGGEHPHGYLRPLFLSTSASNSTYYKNAEVDRLILESMKAPDDAQRDEIYRKIQALIVADAPWLFTYFAKTLWGVSPRLQNVHTHPAGEYELAGITVGGVTGVV